MGDRQPTWEGARNVADLGGLPLIGGGRTAYGRLFRAAAPDGVRPAGWARAQEDGLRTVVDLRNDEERGAAAIPAGLDRVHAPTEDPHDPRFLAACGPWLDHPRSWEDNLRLCPEQAAAAFRAVADARPGVLVHCAGGRDRTGMVCALVLLLNGVEHEAVVGDYERGFRGAAAHGGHGLAYDAAAGRWVPAPDEVHAPDELDDAVRARTAFLREWLAATDARVLLGAAGVPEDAVDRLAVLLQPAGRFTA